MEYNWNIRITLKNINKEKKTGSIFHEIVFIRKSDKRKIRRYINTEQKINTNDFVKSKIKIVDRTKVIRQIVDKKTVELRDLLLKMELSNGALSPEIYDRSTQSHPYASKSVFELFDLFLKHQANEHEPLTVKKHMTLKALLIEYTEAKNIRGLQLNDIDINFFNRFTKFLQLEKKHAPSTIQKYQGCFKTFLKYLTDELTLNQEEIHKKFKKVTKVNDGGAKVVLIKEHVKKLIEWTPSNERFALVKDLFIFQILTGIRYSDLKRVDKSFIMNNSLSFVMWKTNIRVTIPLHPIAMEILKKHNYSLAENCKSSQKYNKDLKIICEKAGLTETISSLKIVLNKKVADQTPLYKLISNHVGRTTFITNCLIAGISPFIVMTYSGHTKITSLSAYMRIAGDMASDAFNKYEEYFNF